MPYGAIAFLVKSFSKPSELVDIQESKIAYHAGVRYWNRRSRWGTL